VSERWLTMGEIVEAQKEGRVSSLLRCACMFTCCVSREVTRSHCQCGSAVVDSV
jgi:hypothetical protein